MTREQVPEALDWRRIDRDRLAGLLSRGLTPEQVGALYGRSASSVRLVARSWGLDCRALRARALGLVATHPAVAAQFVEVVDGAPPHYRAVDLLSGSGARCRWRCEICTEEWITSVANRTRRRSGCPACADAAATTSARARRAKTPPLADVSEHLARDFRENLSRPERDATTTPSGSHDRILWRCKRGHEWQTTARQRARHRTMCPTCLSGLRTSRLEYEVAELVRLATDMEVQVGARRHRTDRASPDHVDLLIVEADLLCDLDPSRWHSGEDAVTRDHRKLERFAGKRYVRIRPRALGLLETQHAGVRQQILLREAAEDDAWIWATAVLEALQSFTPGVQIEPLSERARAAALARADVHWRRLHEDERERSLLSEHPAVARELVHVVERLALTAADLAPSGDDRALWRCSVCRHEWEARVANRTVLGTGCPPCSYRRGAALAARPKPGQSFADRHPELVSSFVEDETNPDLTLLDLKPNSLDRCLWTCTYCGHRWSATPQRRHRNPKARCRTCRYSRGADVL